MRDGIRFLLLLSILSIGILSSMIFSTKPAAANEDGWQSNWRVDADFIGDKPNVTLTVDVWEIVDGVPLPLPSETRDLNCFVSPEVSLVNDTAVFSGSGAIRCSIPSLRQIVYEMTEGKFLLQAACDCKDGASAWADVALVGNSSPVDFANPILSLNDIDFSAPIATGGGNRPNLELIVDDETAESELYTALPGGDDLYARFMPIAEDKYQPLFTANFAGLSAAPALIQEDLQISNHQRILYIGFSPSTGESLHGTLTSLGGDPGCFGSGG